MRLVVIWLLLFQVGYLRAAETFLPPTAQVINAASKRIKLFELNQEKYAPALLYLKSLPRENIIAKAPPSKNGLVEEKVPVYNLKSTFLSTILVSENPFKAQVLFDPKAVDYVDGAELISLGQIMAVQITQLIYPDIFEGAWKQKWMEVYAQAIRVSDFTLRRDDLSQKSQVDDKPLFKLLPHFDFNKSSSDHLNPFDAIMVVAMEAHGFGSQYIQIGLTPKSNIDTGAAIDEAQVYMIHEIFIKSGLGYFIMQRQLEEDEWVIVHTATPIFAKNIDADAERCMMIINSRFFEGTEFTKDYETLDPLADK